MMSVYNGEKFLMQAVESILNQTYRNFEFIIIDDGSTDNSKKILEEHAAKDLRIRLISHENRGVPKSLNQGLAQARGEFIALMDGDDIAYPLRFEKQVEFLQRNQEVVALGSLARYINSSGMPLFVRKLPLNHEVIEQCHCADWGAFMVNSTVMVRRRAVKAVGNFDEACLCAQDYDLWFRLGVIGKLSNLPEVLLDYRVHPESITHSRQAEQTAERRRILACALKRRGLATSLPLPAEYPVPTPSNLADTEWLLREASRSGCVRTTFLCGLRILFRNSRSIARSLYFMGRVFFNR
jgi:glycosyltransferase involved in cell wall biosynthesis